MKRVKVENPAYYRVAFYEHTKGWGRDGFKPSGAGDLTFPEIIARTKNEIAIIFLADKPDWVQISIINDSNAPDNLVLQHFTKLFNANKAEIRKIKNPTSQHKELEKNIEELFRLLDRAKLKNIFTAPISVALSLVNTAIEKGNNLIKEALKQV